MSGTNCADCAKAAKQPALLSVLSSVLLDRASWEPGPIQAAVIAIGAAVTKPVDRHDHMEANRESIEADRAKAAEVLGLSWAEHLTPPERKQRDAIAAALASERAAAVADLRARVRDWIGDVAFRPNDIVLGQTAVTADQLPDLHRLLDALDPEWRDWTDGAKRDRRRAAVTDTTGGTQ